MERKGGTTGSKNRREGWKKKTMGGFVPVFRDWKLPDTGETRPRRINNDARQRPFANIEAYVTIHCRAPMFLPSSKFNLTFQIPSLSSLSSIFPSSRCLIIFRFSFFSLSLLVCSHGVHAVVFRRQPSHGNFNGEKTLGAWSSVYRWRETFQRMNSDRFSSYPFLCSPACQLFLFFPFHPCKAEWRSPPGCFGVFHKRDIKNGGKRAFDWNRPRFIKLKRTFVVAVKFADSFLLTLSRTVILVAAFPESWNWR